MVPDPNRFVMQVSGFAFGTRSVVMKPLPKGLVSVVVPSDQRVIVPVPKFWVMPVTVLPLWLRSVVMEPLPNG
jgi:hypothetical protein